MWKVERMRRMETEVQNRNGIVRTQWKGWKRIEECERMIQIDCPESGPGPHGPGSGPDRTLGSECPGQREGRPALFWKVGSRC